ncbi:hypothetical protein BU15DRAFT_65736 [Melanogaster broomeanus]|nr:hypothetical protein BU15DRAFT_65736 [Melanogaster broomeanus]
MIRPSEPHSAIAYAHETSVKWSEADHLDDQLGPLPMSWSLSQSPKVLAGIASRSIALISPEEPVRRWSEQNSVNFAPTMFALPVRAVLVELDPEPATKNKGMDPSERGPEYEALRQRAGGGTTRETKLSDSPLHPKHENLSGAQSTAQRHFTWQRAASELPDGGYFRQATTQPAGPPRPPSLSSSDSSSSSSDDSSSSDSEGPVESASHRRKRAKKYSRTKERRKIKKLMSGVRIKPPFVWNGRADLDLFDQWVYQVDTWCELSGLDEKVTIKLIGNFLSDLPSQFFMKHVALRQNDWTKAKIYEALFDYCFPPDFKMQLRRKLTMAKQGRDTKLRDFVRDLESLCVRFPEVSSSQLVQIFWDGMLPYLRVYLLEQGMKPDRSTLLEMVEIATRKEEAVTLARKEKIEGNPYTNEYQRFKSRNVGMEAYRPKDDKPKGDGDQKASTSRGKDKPPAAGGKPGLDPSSKGLRNGPSCKRLGSVSTLILTRLAEEEAAIRLNAIGINVASASGDLEPDTGPEDNGQIPYLVLQNDLARADGLDVAVVRARGHREHVNAAEPTLSFWDTSVDEEDWTYPALSWLSAASMGSGCMTAIWSLTQLRVTPARGGYDVHVDDLRTIIFVPHEDIRSRDFCVDEDQLGLKKEILAKPLPLQLAVHWIAIEDQLCGDSQVPVPGALTATGGSMWHTVPLPAPGDVGDESNARGHWIGAAFGS